MVGNYDILRFQHNLYIEFKTWRIAVNKQVVDYYFTLSKKVGILFFADDVMLFAKVTLSRVEVIKRCLDDFCAMSWRKVSYTNSSVYFSNNTSMDMIEEICWILEMPRTEDLGRYLGVPTLHGRISRSAYQGVIEQADKRLAGWKSKCLSLAGCLTLIKSTVCAIPAYVMQTAKNPRSVCDEINRKIRRFLSGAPVWRGSSILHLGPWSLGRRVGRVGLACNKGPKYDPFNENWVAPPYGPDETWAWVLWYKYCQGGELFQPLNKTLAPNVSNVWREVVENLGKLWNAMGMAVGDGRATRFWMDR